MPKYNKSAKERQLFLAALFRDGRLFSVPGRDNPSENGGNHLSGGSVSVILKRRNQQERHKKTQNDSENHENLKPIRLPANHPAFSQDSSSAPPQSVPSATPIREVMHANTAI